MLLVSHEEVELRVLLHFNTQFIESLDRSVAGKEVLRTWTEGDDLQTLQTDDNACDGHELSHHLSHFFCSTYRIFRNITLQVTHTEVVRAVEHTAVSIATAVDHITVAFSCGNEHARTIKILGDKGLRGLRAKVAEEYHEGIASSFFYLSHCLEHILLILYSCLTIEEVTFVGFDDVLSALCREGDGETVAAHGNNTEFNLGDVCTLHNHYCYWLLLLLVLKRSVVCLTEGEHRQTPAKISIFFI